MKKSKVFSRFLALIMLLTFLCPCVMADEIGEMATPAPAQKTDGDESVKDACGAKPEQPNVVAYTSAFIAFGLYGWIEEWFKRGMQESPEEMARLWEATQQKQ